MDLDASIRQAYAPVLEGRQPTTAVGTRILPRERSTHSSIFSARKSLIVCSDMWTSSSDPSIEPPRTLVRSGGQLQIGGWTGSIGGLIGAAAGIAWTRITDANEIAGERVVPFVTDKAEGFSIDYESDWDQAERMVERLA